MRACSKSRIRVIACFCLYVVSYIVFMDRSNPAINSENQVAFKSCSRFGSYTDNMTGGVSVAYHKVSIANYVFLPLDYFYHKVADTNYASGYERFFSDKEWFIMK